MRGRRGYFGTQGGKEGGKVDKTTLGEQQTKKGIQKEGKRLRPLTQPDPTRKDFQKNPPSDNKWPAKKIDKEKCGTHHDPCSALSLKHLLA